MGNQQLWQDPLRQFCKRIFGKIHYDSFAKRIFGKIHYDTFSPSSANPVNSMELLQSFKDDYRALRDGQPGERFRQYVEHRQETRHGLRRVLTFVFGIALIAVGLGIGWLPGPGGFVALIGLAILAREVPVIADLMDQAELLIRKIFHSIKQAFSHKRSSKT